LFCGALLALVTVVAAFAQLPTAAISGFRPSAATILGAHSAVLKEIIGFPDIHAAF
jgi:hypothetical protein